MTNSAAQISRALMHLFDQVLRIARSDAEGRFAPGCLSTAIAVGKSRCTMRRWRTQEDSNLWPLPSEGSALSS